MRLVERKEGEKTLRNGRRKIVRLPRRGRIRDLPPWREMHDRYGWLLRGFFRRFFRPIRLSSWQESRLKELNETGHVIYVMERSSILYYLFLNYTCLRLRLPLAYYGNGIRSFFLFQPMGKVLRALWARVRGRSQGTAGAPASASGTPGDDPERRSRVLFLRKYQRFGRRRYIEAKEYLEELVSFYAGSRLPVYLVPIGILWGKGPDKLHQGFLDVFLGRKEDPGRIRQILVLLRYSRHSMMTMGQVMDLHAYRKQNMHLEKDLMLKKMRWSLHRELDLAKTSITGPRIKPRKYILESILSSRTLRDQAREIARSEGKSFEKVMKKAEKYADEIAADYRITYIEFLNLLLTWVWNNIYSGFSVDMKGLDRVKTAIRKGSSVILMPSHKSHLDYLVLSYVFYQNDLPPPHIAAGVNLSFWPLGHIFRRAGAFFLRRSIRGQKLYAAVFSAYLRKLLREGYVQEFFLEGSRSRTGKLLQPKLGMLSMELDAFGEGVAEDLQLVPISITYEKIVEETSYTKELGGGRKKKEGFLGLLKTPQFLKKKYGRVYIQFARPLSLREYLKTKKYDLAGMGGVRRRGMVEDLALRVSYAINQVTTVTPAALAATVLLNHPKRGITLSEVTRHASFLLRLLQDLEARRSLVLKNLPWAMEESLEGFVGDKIVQRWDDPDGPIYTLEDNKRIVLDYYKNNILHFFLPFALAANVFRLYRTDRLQEARFLSGFRVFVEILSIEFLFPREDPVGSLWSTVHEHFCERRSYLLRDDRNEIHVREPLPLRYLARLMMNYFESYYIFLNAAERILGSGECEEKDFYNQVLRWADGLYRRGDVLRRESRSSPLFRNALACMVAQGCIRRTKSKGGTVLCLEAAGREKMGLYKRTLSQLLFADESSTSLLTPKQ